MKMRRGWPACLVALVLAAPSLGAKPAGRQPAAVPVLAAPVAVRAMPVSLTAVGLVEPIETAAVTAQVTGLITEVAFSEGQDVERGRLLFRIDPRPLEAALAAAQAQLARAEAEAGNARVQAERYERLVGREFVTRQQAEEATTQAAMMEAAVRAAEAAVQKAQLDLDYASVRAPISGRTGAALTRAGNLARANDTPLVVINRLRPIRVGFEVPGTRLADVRRGLAAGALRVSLLTGAADSLAQGVVTFLDNAVDARTGTVNLKAEFANADEALWPGQFVQVELILAVEPSALTVPEGAVVDGQQGTFVYVVDKDSRAQARPVVVSRTRDGLAVIAEGVAAGDTVVVDGQLRLVPGAAVRIKPQLGPQ